ncbi:MAG TPA: hypothetical protein EYN73_08595 [Chromatiaceae bacterium]|nr:hypothetical protein [Chromatiaceae bacterium]HIA09104.1 hypothetical protein [Chromatiaceae bacterium]HIN81846.1 hypothetical protein [Chromatiales bacterium]HIO14338.1 hypothetical protein [Chromatiales bacterium]HIO54843.1 hypothetical protein [Chromatiales bacterium]
MLCSEAMLRTLSTLFALGLTLVTGGALAADSDASFTLSADVWASPRSGLSVRNMVGVAEAVKRLNSTDSAQLQVHFPQGENGSLWADELRAWLVSLGLESSRIQLYPDASSDHGLTLRVAEVQ